MPSKKKERLSTDGGNDLEADNPFAGLSLQGLPDKPKSASVAFSKPVKAEPKRKKGPAPRLNLRRLKSGRGGKTVTEISGFIGVSKSQLEAFAKRYKSTCGVGGSVRGQAIEIQGDQREKLRGVLESEGYQVVYAGG
jgi:translation initiation factor 1|tara:strand:- start:5861 stop:6271 length:411 start_codon:yes stop_codon:yes gene_type:complete